MSFKSTALDHVRTSSLKSRFLNVGDRFAPKSKRRKGGIITILEVDEFSTSKVVDELGRHSTISLQRLRESWTKVPT